MDPEALRFAADCFQKKLDKLLREGREAEADRAFDAMIRLRLEANQMEDARWRKTGQSPD